MNPQPNWKKITVEEVVSIPHADGQGIAQTLKVPVKAWQDPDDGEIYLDAAAMKKLDDVRARHMGIMLPDEIQELRGYLGLTQADISRLLQIGEKTWTRWENGRSRPTHGYNLILNALADGRIDQNYLELRAGATKPTVPSMPSKPAHNRQILYRITSTGNALIPEQSS